MSDNENQDQGSSSEQELSALQQLVGEGKKFQDEEHLAAGKIAADNHIQHIQNENSDLRKQLEDQNQLQADLAAKLEQATKVIESVTQQPQAEQDPAPQVAENQPQDIEALVAKALSQREAQQSAEANREQFKNWLTETYGGPEAANQALQATASEVNMSVEQIANLVSSGGSEAAKRLFNAPVTPKAVSSVSNPQPTLSGSTSSMTQSRQSAPTTHLEAKAAAIAEYKEANGGVYNPGDMYAMSDVDKIMKRIMAENGIKRGY